MSDFEFLRFVTIGQYLPTDSMIHRLDPRTRLLSSLLLLLAITVAPHLMGIAIAIVTVIAGLIIARIPLKYALSGLLAPLPIIALLAMIQIFFGFQPDNGPLLWAWGPITISTGDLWNGVALITRFVALILTISLASFCISTTEIVHSLDYFLKPLRLFGIPTYDFILMIQVALRFLPLLAQEAERIAKAQASRGAEWGTGKSNLFQRIRQAFPLLIPLFLTSLRRAENLALAMEARGYQSGERRTALQQFHFQLADGIALFLILPIIYFVIRS